MKLDTAGGAARPRGMSPRQRRATPRQRRATPRQRRATPRQRRALAIVFGLLALGVATALVLNAFRSNLVFFFSPSQIAAHEAPQERSFRLGGLVERGSLTRAATGLTVRFVVTDLARTVPVVYTGLLPDLFTEGKGVVAQGRLGADGVFRAEQVLAKHDENYVAPEVGQALADARGGKSGAVRP